MSNGTPPASEIPVVSIVLPTFNEAPAVIRSCIASIEAQTLTQFECLIIDDSTRPESSKCWQEWADADPRVRVIRPKSRLGLPASLNEGVRQARADFIARIDTDDPCHPTRLQRQSEFLRAHPDVDVVGTAMEIFDDASNRLGDRYYPESNADIVRKMAWTTGIAHPTVMMRRSAFNRGGFYDETFRNAEDLDLWLRFMRKGLRFANLPERLVSCTIDRGGRPRRHWRYNLRARTRNLMRQHTALQALGILFAAAASVLPPAVFSRIQNRVQLR